MSNNPNRFYSHLGGRFSITWTMWLLTLPLSIFQTLAFVPSGIRGNFLKWIMLALLAHLATGVVLLLGKFIFFSGRKENKQKIAVVAVFAFSGVARGITVGELSVRFKIESDPYFAFRIPSATFIMMFTYILLSIVIENNRSNRLENAILQRDINDLRVLKKGSHLAIQRVRTEVIDTLEEILNSNFSHEVSSKQISDIAEKVVRPLGHNLFFNRFKSTQSPKQAFKKQRLKPREFSALVTSLITAKPFNLLIIASAEIFIPLPLKIYTLGFGFELIASLLPILVPLSIIRLAELLRSKQIRSDGKSFSLGKVSGIWLVAAGSSAIVSNSVPVFHTYLPNPGLWAFLQLILFILISALFYGLQIERNNVRKDLIVTTESLRTQEVFLKRQLAIEERRLGKIIHGGVQARLILFATQLIQSKNAQKVPQLDFVSQINLMLEDSFKQINQDVTDFDFTQSLEALIDLWEPILNIDITVSDRVLSLLKSEPIIAVAVLEVIGEALSNALRHGRANKALIEILAEESNQVLIRIIDNGQIAKPYRAGVGSHLYDEISGNWKLLAKGSRTELTLRIELPEIFREDRSEGVDNFSSRAGTFKV